MKNKWQGEEVSLIKDAIPNRVKLVIDGYAVASVDIVKKVTMSEFGERPAAADLLSACRAVHGPPIQQAKPAPNPKRRQRFCRCGAPAIGYSNFGGWACDRHYDE